MIALSEAQHCGVCRKPTDGLVAFNNVGFNHRFARVTTTLMISRPQPLDSNVHA